MTGACCNQRSRVDCCPPDDQRDANRLQPSLVERRTKARSCGLPLFRCKKTRGQPGPARLTDKRSNISDRSVSFLYTSILFLLFFLFFFPFFLYLSFPVSLPFLADSLSLSEIPTHTDTSLSHSLLYLLSPSLSSISIWRRYVPSSFRPTLNFIKNTDYFLVAHNFK